MIKYIPIRTTGYLGNFDITINDIFIGNESFGKIYMLANISPGNVEITNLDLRKDNIYLSISVKLLANNFKLQLEVRIKDGLFIIDSITPTTLLALRNRLLNEVD